jgi:hypothetical protein
MPIFKFVNFFTTEQVQALTKKCTFIIRIILFISTSLAAISLITLIFTGGKMVYFYPDTILEGITSIIIMTTLYFVIFLTIPSLILLMALWLGNKYRNELFLLSLKIEIKLFVINTIVLLLDAGLIVLENIKTR